MRGKVAKRLRKEIYGADYSPRFRKYAWTGIGGIKSDDRRHRYQVIKRQYLTLNRATRTKAMAR